VDLVRIRLTIEETIGSLESPGDGLVDEDPASGLVIEEMEVGEGRRLNLRNVEVTCSPLRERESSF